ncbi:MAG: hypothetical protein KatS3mg105_3514 [Gemmatales bacterium]|nr:MAG: hypothetical protein KatS3mg105_3514 [Gemmatales bacterium]
MNVERRKWLRWLGRGLRVVVTGSFLAAVAGLFHARPRQPHTQKTRIDELADFSFRPPGALPEPEFLSRCIHCFLCQDVCPPGCIQMKPVTEPDRHTPHILPRVKACTLCLKCGQVCPTGALRPLDNKSQVRMGVARVDEQLCVSHLRTGVCGACYTICPMRGKAITQGLFNAPTVHPDFCTGCGLCEEVCIVPYRAIRVYPLPKAAKETA